jgi:hypothetical protein
MAIRRTTEQFIIDAKKVHGDRYDYSNTIYINTRKKIKFICRVHGEIEQKPEKHLIGNGCRMCSDNARSKTQEQFLIDAKKAHGDIYDYSKVKYVGNKNKVIIICKEHGEFSQIPNGHTAGKGCRKCADAVNSKNYSHGKNGFVIKSNLKHNNKYDYSKVEYKNNKSRVIIICPIHGEFKQIAADHLHGYGCQKCGYEFVGKHNSIISKNNPTGNGYRDSYWYEKSLTSNRFDSYKVYLVKFYNEDEVFYKIGKSFRTTKIRLNGIKVKYNAEVIKEIINNNAKKICDLERKLHKKNKHLKYVPKITFAGMHECFQYTDQIIFE